MEEGISEYMIQFTYITNAFEFKNKMTLYVTENRLTESNKKENGGKKEFRSIYWNLQKRTAQTLCQMVHYENGKENQSAIKQKKSVSRGKLLKMQWKAFSHLRVLVSLL